MDVTLANAALEWLLNPRPGGAGLSRGAIAGAIGVERRTVYRWHGLHGRIEHPPRSDAHRRALVALAVQRGWTPQVPVPVPQPLAAAAAATGAGTAAPETS